MRILIVVQNYPPEKGAVRYTSDLASSLAGKGHEVTVVTGLPHYPVGKPLPGYGRFRFRTDVEGGVKVKRVPLLMASNRQPLKRLIGFISFAFSAIAAALRSERPDVIVASVPPPTVAMVGYLVSVLRRAPLVSLLRDVEPQASLHRRGVLTPKLAKLVARPFVSVYRKSSRIVVIHESQRQQLEVEDISPDRTDCIPHSLDIQRFDSLAGLDCKLEGCSNGRLRAVYAGTLGVFHDLETFIRMLGDDEVRRFPIDFVFVGDGERQEACAAIARQLNLSNVSFSKPVPWTTVPTILNSADLLISSYVGSPYVGIGSKIVEYFASGKAILVHGPQAIRQVISRAGCGWTCRNGNLDDLRQALREFVEQGEEYTDKCRKAREFALTNLQVEHAGERWESLLQEAMPGHESRVSIG